jgi:ABC-2 type transport system permease protein
VEFVRQLRRRRTQVAVLILLALPIAVALAFKFGGGPSTGSSTTRGSELVDLATTGGSNFAVFLEFAATGFLLVVIVALFCGDAVASEASWSSLRYLLALPVPRARLLRQKLIVALVFSFGANVLLPAWSLSMGTAFFGGAPAVSPSGTTFTITQSLARLGIVIVYLCGQSLVVAALGFLLSVSVDNPLGAVGGATLLVVLSNILDQITALDPYRRYLPTHFQYSWTDVLSRDIDWADMTRGTGLAFVYAAVFLAVAWLRFERKDVTS